ncbi:hypothetical protein HY734_00475 [Candidatus Uhrbacteria bacterium]|nr:hypothetical protein [Candidatus Uhrbacteria bacterium]
MELIPSLLVDDREAFERRLRLVEPYVKTVHVDILDGTLFPATSWFDAASVGALATSVRYELHIMVTNPLPIIAEWKALVPGTCRAYVHAEIERPLRRVLEEIRDVHQLETGVALNQETPVEEIQTLLRDLQALLIMGVHPGSSGQPFEGDYVLEKIRLAHSRRPDLPIEIDGGVTKALIPSLMQAGASRFCCASAIFGETNPTDALRQLQETLEMEDRSTPAKNA